MKPVKNLVFAALLTSVLAVSVFAGDQGTAGAPAPCDGSTCPRITTTTTEETPTDTSTDTQQTTVDTSDYIIYEALAALLSVY